MIKSSSDYFQKCIMSEVSRPSRGARVVYKEADSSDEEEEFESEEAFAYAAAAEEMYQSVLPPLTPLQLELRQLCRSGNKAMLKTFLVNNPEIDLDVKDPEGKKDTMKTILLIILLLIFQLEQLLSMKQQPKLPSLQRLSPCYSRQGLAWR